MRWLCLMMLMGCTVSAVEEIKNDDDLLSLDPLDTDVAAVAVDEDQDGVDAEQDCDDNDPARAPGLAEVCDGIDNDCDGQLGADEIDGDADGVLLCLDCDDTNPTIYPGAPELCDALDNDCDSMLGDNELLDGDGDGYTVCDGDCDDSAFEASPEGVETCDGLDNDCDGNLPLGEEDFSGDGMPDCDASECPQPGRPGMTWALTTTDAALGTVRASCHGDVSCNAYAGDHACGEARPLLCFLDQGAPNPGGLSNWSGGESGLTTPIAGCQLTSIVATNNICRGWFGAGARMASHHDGGGWSFWSFGTWTTSERFWVGINDQPANCWD